MAVHERRCTSDGTASRATAVVSRRCCSRTEGWCLVGDLHGLDWAAGLRAVQNSANNSKVVVVAGWKGLIALSPHSWTTGRCGREAAAAEGLEQRRQKAEHGRSCVNFLIGKLTNFLDNEVQFFRGAEEEVSSVRGQLECIRACLRVADSLEESDEEVKAWVKQLREIAYVTEDALDEFKLLSVHDHGVGFAGLFCRISCSVKNMKARYRTISQIQNINSTMKSLCDGHQRLRHKFSKAEHGPDSNYSGNRRHEHRGNAFFLDKNELVGIEEPKKQLVAWLGEGTSRPQVISVVGMGGSGKTTLVNEVYEDPVVKTHFMVCAWITFSGSPNIGELLQNMRQQIMRVFRQPIPRGVDTMNIYWLKMLIKDLLKGVRYLVVLDDTWRTDEWDAVKHALPNNMCGSRIIITTRNDDLAHTSCRDFEGKVYKMEPLPVEQSWKLFCMETFHGNSCPSHLEETCEFILRKCEGLPLAIVAISGILATKDKHRIDEWELVRRSLGTEIDRNDQLKNLKRVLLLSFNDLPYYLKSCYLHLSLFPEGRPIKRKRLIRLWIAEGFVEKKEGKTLEEAAKDYFVELLNRSLIEVAARRSDGTVKYCCIHDFLREIVTLKSTNQGFAEIAKEENREWPDKVRRLSLQKNLQALQQNWSMSQLRSLYMFGIERSFMNKVLASDMKLLNVLDMQAAPLTRFPAQVADWCYLRYLSFRHTEVSTVPSSIGKLQNLETLDLKHTKVTELPVEILKLRRLRHLLVYRYKYISYSSVKFGFKALRGIGALQYLQKLCFMEADDESSSSVTRELGMLTQLDRLAILKFRKEDGRDLCLSISKLTRLRSLAVHSVDNDEIIDLQHLSSPPPFLQRIYLRGRLGALPHWLPSLSSLMRLHLSCSRLKDDPLVSLQNLPNLVHLELSEVYQGSSLFFKAKAFKKLRILGLDLFDELRCVDVEKGAMPFLERLIIQRCKLLEKLPSGIEHLRKLKVLEIFDMPDELVKKLVQGGQDDDFHKVAHVPDIYCGYRRDEGWDIQLIDRSVQRDGATAQGTSMGSNEFPTT
ncbi:disease resistance protein RPM1-like [Syzygium oleosum]|uniref:disease resistance protein RPM1-like n=1 Tax=Syzygium oleosum TaxID=219896 RepID=UPI0024B9D3C8|nr:disease resistance protein RPM1-like [Syzygium oleosum]